MKFFHCALMHPPSCCHVSEDIKMKNEECDNLVWSYGFAHCLLVIRILIVPHAYTLICDIVSRIYETILNVVLTLLQQNYYCRFANCNGLSVQNVNSFHLGML
jgi:hypothetical protein